MRAYHFLRDDWTSSSGDEPAWSLGETRTLEGPISLCERGYHASPSWLAALQYAPGPVACLVEVEGVEDEDETKLVSRTRTLVAGRDCSRELRLFACDCAERALRLAGVTDKRSWDASSVARRYADGQATAASLAAARDAAWTAARDAAWAAAWTAARDAAWAAARAAAWTAARDAAWAAAWAAARAAAWTAASAAARDAEPAWQRKRLAELLDTAVGEASR